MKPIFVIFATLIALSAYSETRTCTFTAEVLENVPVSVKWTSPVSVDTTFEFSDPLLMSMKTFGVLEEDSLRLRKVAECAKRLSGVLE
ncbi:MAG: hypothetical protein WCK42_03585, partial [Myxococcaceae bacterium]